MAVESFQERVIGLKIHRLFTVGDEFAFPRQDGQQGAIVMPSIPVYGAAEQNRIAGDKIRFVRAIALLHVFRKKVSKKARAGPAARQCKKR